MQHHACLVKWKELYNLDEINLIFDARALLVLLFVCSSSSTALSCGVVKTQDARLYLPSLYFNIAVLQRIRFHICAAILSGLNFVLALLLIIPYITHTHRCIYTLYTYGIVIYVENVGRNYCTSTYTHFCCGSTLEKCFTLL